MGCWIEEIDGKKIYVCSGRDEYGRAEDILFKEYEPSYTKRMTLEQILKEDNIYKIVYGGDLFGPLP